MSVVIRMLQAKMFLLYFQLQSNCKLFKKGHCGNEKRKRPIHVALSMKVSSKT